MADVISLDSDDEDSKKQPTTTRTPSAYPSQQTTTASPKIRPGPLSAKLKQIQSTEGRISPSLMENLSSKPNVISARDTLAGGSSSTTNSIRRLGLEQQRYDEINDRDSGPVTRNQKKSELELAKLMDNSKFLADFDPVTSIREKRKMNRKSYTEPGRYSGKVQGALYDEKGVHKATGIDLCDCLDKDCVGCHFPCPQCGSTKCGPTCRVHRRWAYECIEYDGKDQVKKNPIVYRYL